MANAGGAGEGRPQLEAYRRKRHPGRTPEPFEAAPVEPGTAPVFVVQRHSARRLHYDLRLERDGVLASWAVPKGLPTTPGTRRLAVHTEDHPLSYVHFEGVIPAGQYGAGTMDVYDQGVWEQVEARKDGGLTFRLQGTRLQGLWTLVPAHLDGEERNWLLLRRASEPDEPPRETPRYEPMLATLETDLPQGDDWLYEVKWDGYRVLARLEDGEPELWSRTGKDSGARFPKVAADLGRGLRSPRIVVDGEICALDDAGRPSFQLLQNGGGTLAYYVFDLLELEGERLCALPLEERRGLLERLVDETSATVRFSRAAADGEELMAFARAQGLEGVMAKRRGSAYQAGRRSGDWRKVKVRLRAPFAVVGWTRGEGSRERLGSLVLGARSPAGGLVWAGQVGSGFSDAELDRVLDRLAPLRRATSPLDQVVRDARLRRGRVTWVEPELRALVEFSEWTKDGRVRAPVYHGLVDLSDEVARVPTPALAAPSLPADAAADELDDAPGGLEALDDPRAWYGRVGPAVVPYLRGRSPVVGAAAPAPGLKGPAEVTGLVKLFGDTWDELAMPLARTATPHEPDLVLFDLAPMPGARFADVARVALHVRDALAGLGLRAYPKTSGQDNGLHVCLPVAPGLSFEQAAVFARAVAEAVAQAFPAEAAAPARRPPRGTVLIDWRGNTDGAVIRAPYAVSADGRDVSCPLRWEDLDPPIAPERLTRAAVVERLDRLGDPFAPALAGGQDVRPYVGGG